MQLEVLISVNVKVIVTEELQFRLAKLFEDVTITYVNRGSKLTKVFRGGS